jgi:hypothetical protein
MSVYQVNKLCYDLKREENRGLFTTDPEAYYRRYNLDEDEVSALRSGDYSWLFDQGVNIYVLTTHTALNGYDLGTLKDLMMQQYEQRRAGAR